MNRALLITIICSLISINSFGQRKYKTNLEIFDEIISSGLEKFIYYPDLNRTNQFIFIINPGNPGNTDKVKRLETRYLTGIIKKKASEEKLRFSFTEDENKVLFDSAYNIFILKSIIMQTKYNGFKKNRFLGEKTLGRNIKIKISIDVKFSESSVKVLDFIENDYTDEVNLDDFENIESSEYVFTQDIPPEIGPFENIVFPALLITFSAAATLLFFIIRTK